LFQPCRHGYFVALTKKTHTPTISPANGSSRKVGPDLARSTHNTRHPYLGSGRGDPGALLWKVAQRPAAPDDLCGGKTFEAVQREMGSRPK
jgi:hypothetical protein